MFERRVVDPTAKLWTCARSIRVGLAAAASYVVFGASASGSALAVAPDAELARSEPATVTESRDDTQSGPSPERSTLAERGAERLPPHLDFEIDPIAYALRGFSLHSGIRLHHFRIDLGVFGLEMPKALTGDDRFRTRFAGFGAKLDYRFFGAGDGPFAGIDFGAARVSAVHESSSLSESHYEFTVSARVGYEFDIYKGFYIVPWVSLGYRIGGRDVTLAGDTLARSSALSVFPTVHLGYRFHGSEILHARRAGRARRRKQRRAQEG